MSFPSSSHIDSCDSDNFTRNANLKRPHEISALELVVNTICLGSYPMY